MCLESAVLVLSLMSHAVLIVGKENIYLVHAI